MKKIVINFGNRTFYTLVFAVIILLIAGISYAAWSNPPVSHSSDSIKVTIAGVDYSLQDAISSGKLSGLQGVVHGTVNKNGAILHGTGFSSSRESAGTYRVTFTPSLTLPPNVIISQSFDNTASPTVYSIGAYDVGADGFSVKIAIGSSYGNADFAFIAIPNSA